MKGYKKVTVPFEKLLSEAGLRRVKMAGMHLVDTVAREEAVEGKSLGFMASAAAYRENQNGAEDQRGVLQRAVM